MHSLPTAVCGKQNKIKGKGKWTGGLCRGMGHVQPIYPCFCEDDGRKLDLIAIAGVCSDAV